jgi:hypothetical protein
MPRKIDNLIVVVMGGNIPLNLTALQVIQSIDDLELQGFQSMGSGQSTANAIDRAQELMVTVQVRPGRVDFVVRQHSEPDPPDLTSGIMPPPRFPPPAMDNLQSALALAVPVGKRLAAEYAAQRLALVADTSETAESPEAALAGLAAIVPNLPTAAHANEMNFQINTRRPSAASATTYINRNARWFVGQRALVAIQIGNSHGGVTAPQTTNASAVIGAHIDINTAQETGLEVGTAAAIFDEMVSALVSLHQDGFNAFG